MTSYHFTQKTHEKSRSQFYWIHPWKFFQKSLEIFVKNVEVCTYSVGLGLEVFPQFFSFLKNMESKLMGILIDPLLSHLLTQTWHPLTHLNLLSEIFITSLRRTIWKKFLKNWYFFKYCTIRNVSHLKCSNCYSLKN